MKSVLISIQPKWVEKIATRRKTIEVRKTAPKIATPFKCYIYCTKSRKPYESFGVNNRPVECGGYVIGEFVCDFITQYDAELWDDDTFERIREVYEPEDFSEYGEHEYKTIADNSDDFWKDNMLCKASCVSIEELREYIGAGINDFYGWHISDLVIYDEPKPLSDFYTWKKCNSCKVSGYESAACIYDENCKVPAVITRPPQSWCYVEELNNDSDCQKGVLTMPNKKSIQIKDSYRIWSPYEMRENIKFECDLEYGTFLADSLLNRSYLSMYIEWWLHNIGYYITKPFCRIPFIMEINMRCADVDLEEH